MPITVEVVDGYVKSSDLEEVFDYFVYVDNKFSTYKKDSEISKINKGGIKPQDYSKDMKYIFNQAEKTKQETNGYFDIYRSGRCDPSGLVKGWAIKNAANILQGKGFKNYYIEAGGDIQTAGTNSHGQAWRVGIRNPFNRDEVVKVLKISGLGVATSGTYIRGEHVYDPHKSQPLESEIVSLTVVGPNVYDADRFATAAFAMGKSGIYFIENLTGFEGYSINKNGQATFTSNFNLYLN